MIDLGGGDNILDAGNNADVDPDTGKYTFYNVRVSAGKGNDIIDAGVGNYSIDAGSGNNWVYLTAGNVSVLASSGNDVITTNPNGGFDELLTDTLIRVGNTSIGVLKGYIGSVGSV